MYLRDIPKNRGGHPNPQTVAFPNKGSKMVHGPWWILVGPPLQKHPTSEVPVHQADHAGVEAIFQHLDPTGLSTATVLGSAVRF